MSGHTDAELLQGWLAAERDRAAARWEELKPKSYDVEAGKHPLIKVDTTPTHLKNVRLTDEPMILPADSATRKNIPIGSGVLDYFPRAMAAIAMLSKAGNDQHNPGQPLHWSKDKSTDHPDCIIRHYIDRGKIDPVSGMLHDVGMAWRALANLECVLEKKELEG